MSTAIGVSGLAHLFGIVSIILLLVWLLHYREGIDYDSDDGLRVFNVKYFQFVAICLHISITYHVKLEFFYVGASFDDVLGIYFPCW